MLNATLVHVSAVRHERFGAAYKACPQQHVTVQTNVAIPEMHMRKKQSRRTTAYIHHSNENGTQQAMNGWLS